RFAGIRNSDRALIARLNSTGTLDTTFDPGTIEGEGIRLVLARKDGKILLGGNFSSINKVTCQNLALLNADGSVDAAFSQGAAVEGPVWTGAYGPDGKLVIAGDFTRVNGVDRKGIARLNAY